MNKAYGFMRANGSKIFGAFFYSLLILFLYLYIDRIDFAKIRSIEISWLYLGIATFFGMAVRYYSAYIWIVILKGLGAQDIYFSKELINVYAKAWLGRYIPGKAPWILGKIYFASKHGVSKNKLAVSSLLEGGLQIAVTFAIAFLILILDTRTDFIDAWIRLVMLGILAICIVAILPPVFNKIISILYKIAKRKILDSSHLASNQTVITGARLYAINSILGGFSFYFATKAVYPGIEWWDFLYVVGVSNLASAFSMLAIFAPSGIGVRESVQVVLFAAIMPVEIAISIAIISRLWSVVVDLLFYAVARLLNK